MGIEPTSSAWEADILPMNYARDELLSADQIEYARSVLIEHLSGE